VSLPIAVAAWGWVVVALFAAIAVVAVVAGHRRLTADPASRRRFRWVLVLMVVAPSAVFALVAGVVVAQGTPSWDTSILLLMARHQQQAARAIVRTISATGSVPAVLVLLSAALAVLLFARLYRQAAFVAAATLLSMTVSGAMKLVFARTRPEVIAQTPGGWSFPSGHTTSATGFAVALVIVLWATPWRRPALVAAAVYAVGIGLTRLYLGVHFPSDVVAGWALSVAIVGVTWLAFWDRLEPEPAEPRAAVTSRDHISPAQGG
jgi:undecaprenyl-diphosphatase